MLCLFIDLCRRKRGWTAARCRRRANANTQSASPGVGHVRQNLTQIENRRVSFVNSLRLSKIHTPGRIYRNKVELPFHKLNSSNDAKVDKTGTVTVGKLEVVLLKAHGADESELLTASATCASASQRPVSLAITAFAEEKRQGSSPDGFNVQELPGRGVTFYSEHGQWLLGRRTWLIESGKK